MSIHLRRAQLLMQQHRYELAEEQLRLALAEGTEAATAHALLALSLMQRDKFDDATKEAEQSIHEAPQEAFGFYALATIQLRRHLWNEARESIAEAIRLEPWNADYFSVLSGIEAGQFRWEQSLLAAEQGLQCDPDHIGCNNLRAAALVNLGRRKEAGISIDAILSKNPEDAVTHANQGWTRLHEQRPNEAIVHFREALRLEPNLEWARLGIVEAMKARFFGYRWLLSFFLWMSRFPPKVRIALVLGMIFGRSLLASAMQMVPILEPLVLPLSIAYVLFVWMTWTAPSLFNLVLQLDSFGRLVLNPNERLESILVGVCMILCFAVGSTSLLFDHRLAYVTWQCGLLYLGLMLPLIATFRQPTDRRKMFAVYTLGVTVCILIATYTALDYCHRVNSVAHEPKLSDAKIVELRAASTKASQWFEYSVWGIVISTWIGAGLSLNPERH